MPAASRWVPLAGAVCLFFVLAAADFEPPTAPPSTRSATHALRALERQRPADPGLPDRDLPAWADLGSDRGIGLGAPVAEGVAPPAVQRPAVVGVTPFASPEQALRNASRLAAAAGSPTSRQLRSTRGGDGFQADGLIPWICFAPGTSPATIALISGAPHGHLAPVKGSEKQLRGAAFQFLSTPRWSSTATNQAPRNGPNALRQGDPVTLTWSILPDGTALAANGSITGESSDASNLVAFLNGIYGNQATWLALMQEVFDRWSEVTGNRYVYEPNDDGASFPGTPGSLGLRGDVRIGGHRIDGGFNTLAYNYGPTTGDMVIDTADSYFNSTSNHSLRFRNVFAHEHGHGLGLAHVCPQNSTKLMEPTATSVFDGPQHDDIFSAQRQYGDRYEDTDSDNSSDDNDAFSRRTDLGLLPLGTTVLTPLSIDDNSDQDYLSFTMGTTSTELSVTLKPLGLTYLEGGQNGDGSCSGGTTFNSKAVHNLAFSVLDSGGTVLLTQNANPAGVDEAITGFALPAGTGPFTLRVFGDSTNNAQLYELQIHLSAPTPLPEISIADATASESAGSITFDLTLSSPSGLAISVLFATANSGTATAGDDFVLLSTTVAFAPGETTKSVSIDLLDDEQAEPDETFSAQISNPVNAAIGDSTATITILDDDAPALLAESGTLASDAGSGAISIGWDAVAGRSYTILFSIDLVSWEPLPGAELITATTSSATFVHSPAPNPTGFYRIVEGYRP